MLSAVYYRACKWCTVTIVLEIITRDLTTHYTNKVISNHVMGFLKLKRWCVYRNLNQECSPWRRRLKSSLPSHNISGKCFPLPHVALWIPLMSMRAFFSYIDHHTRRQLSLKPPFPVSCVPDDNGGPIKFLIEKETLMRLWTTYLWERTLIYCIYIPPFLSKEFKGHAWFSPLLIQSHNSPVR